MKTTKQERIVELEAELYRLQREGYTVYGTEITRVSRELATLLVPEMSHTPGPWKWVRFSYAEDGYATSKEVWTLIGAHDSTGYHPRDVLEIKSGADETSMLPEDANARLIAAAPELLEALVSMERLYMTLLKKSGSIDDSIAFSARQAIAKATGGKG